MKPLAILASALLGVTFCTAAETATPPAPAVTKAADKAGKAADKAGKAADKAAADAKEVKPMPMHTKVDTIDAAAKSFTHTTEKGTKVTNKVTATTVIMQGDKAAQFSDIKVGDYVSGLHLKKSDTEYEIVKITKFGPEAKAEKKEAPKKK